MKNDLRFALRMIRTHRWFSAAVIVTLALGIGVNTTVFTLVNAVLFKPVPLPGGERLVMVENRKRGEEHGESGFSYSDFRDLRAQVRAFEAIDAVMPSQEVITETALPPERVSMAYVSAGLFAMLKTQPVLGRPFTAEDDQPGAPRVALLGHGLWQSRYAGAGDVVGRAVRINGEPVTIIGVMPEGLRFPNNEDLWVPLAPTVEMEKRGTRSVHLFGLLQPGVAIEAAGRDIAAIWERLAAEYPDTHREFEPRILTFHEAFNGGPIRLIFLMMLGAVGFVLLIACANVANMMLGRAIHRRREISVRAAMGAARWQIVRQLLVESVLLSSLGGLLGLGLALVGIHAFDRAVQDVGKPYWVQFDMDYVAFGYFAAISVLSGVLFGLVPALRASRVDLNKALKDDTPGAGSRRGHHLAGALVVLQFALTVVLLAGAGVMIRSFFAAQATNAFVPAGHILTAHLQLPEQKGERYAEPAARRQFVERLHPRLLALPGVTHATISSHLPGLGSADRAVEIEGRPPADRKQAPQAAAVMVMPGHLATIGLPLLAGRDFVDTDGLEGHEAAIVTRAFAQQHWPGEPAVGRHFRVLYEDRDGPWHTVVGVSADIVQHLNRPDAAPVIHLPFRHEPWGWMAIMLRSSAEPGVLVQALRSAVQEIDAEMPLFDVRTLPDALDHSRWFLRVFGTLFLVFALIGLLLASVGIYAVVAQTTARRTREIGIRMALGATGGSIARLVLSRGLVQLGIALGLGLAGAAGATLMLARGELLLGVSPHDPLVFVVISILLLAIGLFACWLPARRASRLAPTEALRSE